MKKSLLLFLFIVLAKTGYTQPLSSYGFSAFSGTYSSVSGSFISSSGGTTWGSTAFDDCWYNGIPIGFSFVYCGNTYNSLCASQNCWVALGQNFGTTTVNTYDCDLSNTTAGGFGAFSLQRPIIAALWLDAIVTGNNVRYATTGTTPNRVFTIEWYDCGLYPSTTPAESVEIILYETTNIIDFVYNQTSSGSTGTGHLSIGITDGTGAYPVTGTQNYWSLNNTGTSPTPSMTTESKFLTGLPATNQVYRWSPQCTGTPSAGTVSATVDSGCTSYSTTLSLVGASLTLGLTYQWQSAPSSTGTWTNISGATNATYTGTVSATTWYRCIVTCTNSGISSTSGSIACYLFTPPGGISGPTFVCVGSTITLASSTSGGVWTSSSTGVATVGSSSGVVTGASAGTAIISYSMPTGCYATYTVNVVSAPATIGGPSTVCVGATVTLTDAVSGGTWSSSAPGTATIGSTTGVVTGIAPGVVTITYSLGSCSITRSETVNPSPAPITGPTSVCVGSGITLSDATSGGTWSSSNPFVATVGSSTGAVVGVAAGTVTISYILPGGCYAISVITVNPLPSAILGVPVVCVGQTTTLYCLGSGTWTSSNTAIATVGSSTGVVTGVAAGSATITYTLSTGCYRVLSVTVNPVPAPTTGPTVVCVGATIALSDATTGGIWSSSAPGIAFVDPSSGIVTGVSAGTATISYTIGTGCAATMIVTVNPQPSAITGTLTVCVGGTTPLYNTGGGTWSSSNPAIATIGSTTGVVNGLAPGTSVITYTLSTGCSISATVTVNPLPAAITGAASVCVGQTTLLSDATPGGSWTSGSPGIATIVSTSGLLTGVSIGTSVIRYTLSSGCFITYTVTVTTSPAAITGPATVCVGGTITLADIVPGGTWSSSSIGTATVGSGTGNVSGLATGVATITYSIGTGCYAVKPVTVTPLPAAIAGPGSVCVGATITLTDASPGGTWLSSIPAIATIGSASGLVTGVATGTTVITYTLATGCSITRTITANPLPTAFTVTGGGGYCAGGTGVVVGLSGSVSGNSYQLYNGTAPVGTAIGGTGLPLSFGLQTAAGTYTVRATSGFGCSGPMLGSVTITINPLPSVCPVTGGGNYCSGGPGLHIGLGCSSVGIDYQLMLSGVPVGSGVAGTGGPLDFGLLTAAGTYTVIATNTITGCTRTMSGSAVIVVNPLPAPIGGPSALCVGASIILTSPGTGMWISSTPVVAIIGAGSGVVTGITTGTTTITFTLTSTGCSTTKMVTVSPSPGPILGPSTACVGPATSTLTNATGGGVWTSGTLSVATIGSLTGVVSGVSIGTTLITYSLGSGCTVTRTITINPSPGPISGTSQLCMGGTTTLTNATTGGLWSSTAPGIATVGSLTGIVTAVAPGTTTIIYTIGSGCTASITVTVHPVPAPITGPSTMCTGSSITLSTTTPGATWSSSNPAVGSIGSSTGIVTGMGVGVVVFRCPALSLCPASFTVTVNPLPAAITGPSAVCLGQTITLSSTTPGGVWSSGSPSTASIGSSSGVVAGMSAGTVTMTYTLTGTGCSRTRTISVNPAPGAISGTTSVCVGQTALLTNPVPGGTWASSVPTIASVSPTSGLVTGNTSGTVTITYTVGGCPVFIPFVVIASPAPITGLSNVCVGSTILKSNITPGGTWSSATPATALIGASTGIVTGISSGTVIISYTLGSTGCAAVVPVVVNPVAPILGIPVVCVGQTTLLTDTALGGTWASLSSLVATVGTSGLVTGVTAGTSVINYTSAAGCVASIVVTVNPLPAPIGGTPVACAGQSSLLTNTTPGGTWSSALPSIADVGVSTGLVSAFMPGTSAISYTLAGTGCRVSQVFTVSPSPATISGPNSICLGSPTPFTNTVSGGIWSSSTPSVADVGSLSGVVTGYTIGAATITYMLGSGCIAVKPISVISGPTPTTGIATVCQGGTTMLTNTSGGGSGTWSSGSPLVATVSSTGVVTGWNAGTSAITYSLGTGCIAIRIVTVNPLPGGITGSTNICTGSTSLLSSTGGGTWSSSDITVAAVGSVTGLVSGVSAGTAVITFTSGSGCSVTTIVLVAAGPTPITGLNRICIGSATTLFNATAGGVWTSSAPTIGSVDATGVVYGNALGTAIISYTLPGFLCSATRVVTVNPLPAPIIGSPDVCVGAVTALSDAVPGGMWSSSDITVAPVSSIGVVTGVTAGTATITYSMGAGTSCEATFAIAVNPLPAPISGANAVCAGQSIVLFNTTPGGTWSSSAPATGSVDASGVVYGLTAGVTAISYSNSFGCAVLHPVTVNPAPGPITGSLNVCFGGTSALSNAVPGGNWTSSNLSVATVGLTSGIVSGISLGTSVITYRLPAGCFVTANITVFPLPAVYVVTGGGNHCAGDAGVHIGLSGSAVGVSYMLYLGSTAVGAFPGTGSALDFGLLTVGGTYTVVGTTTATGCSRTMAGSALVGVIPSVTPVVTIGATPDDTVCEGATVTFTPVPVHGGTSPAYLWRVNGIPVATTGTYTYIPANGDAVSVTMTSNAVCPVPATADRAVAMTVQPFGFPVVDLSLNPNDTVCQGTVLTINALSTFGGATPYYTWRLNNTIVGGHGPSYTYAPVNNDVLYVIMNSSYPCRLANLDTSSKVRIKIDTPEMLAVTINASPGFVVLRDEPVTLTAVAPGAVAPEYQWYINGLPVAGATNATFIHSNYNYPQQDSVSCMVTSNDICVVKAHQWTYIKVTTVGVSTIAGAASDLVVVPNPSKGEFMIKGSLGTLNDEEVSLELTNMIGQVVYSNRVQTRNGELNERITTSTNLANGMYLLSVHSESVNRVFHIVIER